MNVTSPTRWFIVIGFLLAITLVVAIELGPAGWMSFEAMFERTPQGSQETAGQSNGTEWLKILWHLRMPRLALGILVGANLAVAGVLMQALFGNPLAEPYIAGVSAGAAFGAVLAISLGMQQTWGGLHGISLFALIGGCLTTLLVYRIAWRRERMALAGLLLTGIAVGGLLQAMTALMILQTDPHRMRGVLVWMMGSLAYRDWSYVVMLAPYSVVGLLVAWRAHRVLNALATGEESAHHLGVGLGKSQFILLSCAAALASSAAAAAGIIAFVGLLVPHLVRITLGANHRLLIPGCMLAGPLLVIWSDLLARNLASDREIPIGIVTGVLGCILFLDLVRQRTGRIY